MLTLRLGTFCMLSIIFCSGSVHAISWRDSIAANESRVEDLWQLAERRGREGRHIGNMYNEYHVLELTCSILGRMIGKEEFVAEIERSTEIDVSNSNDLVTGLAARSLGNWVYIAGRLVDASEEHRIREWNLDCVGELGIPLIAFVGEQNNSTFFDVEGKTLHVLGDVNAGFSERLKTVIRSNPQITTIALGSGGGSVTEAIEAGLFIRKRGLNTTLWNNCYSACTMVFISGLKREIWAPYPSLSFHQISVQGSPLPFDHPAYHRLAAYATAMGVDTRSFLILTMSALPSEFTTPDVSTLCAFHIATWVQRRC